MAISRWRGGRSLTTWSPIKILPLEMSSRPAIIRRAVDFPQPDGPTKTMNSPSGISKLILSTATTSSPKILVTSSRVTSAIPLPPSVPPNGSIVQESLVVFRALLPLYLAPFYLIPARPAQVLSLLDHEQASDGFHDPGSPLTRRRAPRHRNLRTGDYVQISPRLERYLGLPSFTVPPVHR